MSNIAKSIELYANKKCIKIDLLDTTAAIAAQIGSQFNEDAYIHKFLDSSYDIHGIDGVRINIQYQTNRAVTPIKTFLFIKFEYTNYIEKEIFIISDNNGNTDRNKVSNLYYLTKMNYQKPEDSLVNLDIFDNLRLAFDTDNRNRLKLIKIGYEVKRPEEKKWYQKLRS